MKLENVRRRRVKKERRVPMKKQYTGPWRLAHRGICQAAPENTLEAFRAAYHAGIEGLEIDIRMTRDGVIVIHHDETLARLTCGSAHPCTRAVADCTWAELAELELPYANHLMDNWKPDGIQEDEAVDAVRQLGMDPDHPYDRELARENFRIFLEVFQKSLDIRRSGSAALDLAYVACGRLDGFFEKNLKPWDFAAGSVILEEAGGQITIAVRPMEMYTEIAVADTGMGIREEELPEIFKRFYRSRDVEKLEGSGIGLYLSRLILKHEKGYLTAASQPGRGSVFSVFLQNCQKLQ